MKKILYLLPLLLMFACNKNIDIIFNKLVNIEEKDSLESIDLGRGTSNKYYYKIFAMGKDNNDYLLKKAMSVKSTNLYKHSMNIELTEGDVAICLLIDINKIDDKEFKQLIPQHIEEIYNTSGAAPWWRWLHADTMNRQWVITKLSSQIYSKKGSF